MLRGLPFTNCLRQNLEKELQGLESSQDCANQGIDYIRIDISWFRYDSGIGSLWMTSADSNNELWSALGNYMSDSTKREKIKVQVILN